MTFRYNSNSPVTYRVLPPKWRIIEPEDSIPRSASEYLQQLDRESENQTKTADGLITPDQDLVALVFGNQLQLHGDNSDTLAQLILNRRRLTAKHLEDIQWRIDDLMPRRSVNVQEPGRLSEIEKQLFDLERQKRQVELNEWRDLMDLSRALTEVRRQ